jgi:hypothetical protein
MTTDSTQAPSLAWPLRVVGALLTLSAAFLLAQDIAGTAVVVVCLLIGVATLGASWIAPTRPTPQPVRVRSRR